jgi:hypothetical protein
MKRSVKPARTIRFAGFLFCELFALLVSVASLHAGILVFDSFPAVLATEGSPFSGVLGTFTDSVADPTSSLTGTINWGDGTSSAGTIAVSAGVYSLSGTHVYAEEGSYTPILSVADPAQNSGNRSGTASVNDAFLLPTALGPFGFTPGVALSNVVLATFNDGDPGGLVSDYMATISWGDGVSSAGTVASAAGGSFSVAGSHTYASGGTFPVGVTLDDVGGATGFAETSATGSAVPEPGSIGMVCAGLALAGLIRRRRIAHVAPRTIGTVQVRIAE